MNTIRLPLINKERIQDLRIKNSINLFYKRFSERRVGSMKKNKKKTESIFCMGGRIGIIYLNRLNKSVGSLSPINGHIREPFNKETKMMKVKATKMPSPFRVCRKN